MICLAVALGAALLQGGSLRRLATTQFHYPWLVFAGLVVHVGVQLSTPPLAEGVALWLLLVGTSAVAIFLLMNLRYGGLAFAAVGLLLNVAVIAANGAMPVSEEAAAAAGVPISREEAGIRHEVLDAESQLPLLADAIPVAPMNTVLSLGDVLLALGLALFVYRAASKPKGRRLATEPSG